MGQTASQPASSKTIQVIGAGLSRTGTASLAEALRILLGDNGPVYHGGTQMVFSPESHVRKWIAILEHTPYRSDLDRQFVRTNLAEITAGYAAACDMPIHGFLQEMQDLYPNAKVVCTVRDPKAWFESLRPIDGPQVNWAWRQTLLWWLPTFRYFPAYRRALDDHRWKELYYRPEDEWFGQGPWVWERHLGYVKRVVPKEKLLIFDVREGWGPLCRFLDLPAPRHVDGQILPFPKVNDGKARDKVIRMLYVLGYASWLGVFGAITGIVFGAWYMYKNLLYH